MISGMTKRYLRKEVGSVNSQITLYEKSKTGHVFKNLYKRIISRENIILAVRNLRQNSGSKTAGVDGVTIKDLEKLQIDELVDMVRRELANYKPKPVKRVFIPKSNGRLRPLGIPTITDRLIQTCIMQVLEPICEGRFNENSYGFRPDRSCHDALARTKQIIELGKNYYCVDVDIEGFFDNVDHNILIRKVWGIGIQDKKVISLIKKILKSEIVGEGIPEKGTPQGGIISPLLANIYLHELDEWVSGQWEKFETKHTYNSNSKKYESLRRRNLKEIWYVRYADDFKIFCKNKVTARKIKFAVEMWLQERLKLTVSPSKTGITNLTKQSSEFLGFKLKVTKNQTQNKKTDKRVLDIRISDKNLEKVQKEFKKRLLDLPKQPIEKRILHLNLYIQGIQNYYSAARRIGHDLIKLQLIYYRRMKHYEKAGYFQRMDKGNIKDLTYIRKYSRFGFKTYGRNQMPIYPIAGIQGTILRPRKYGLNPYAGGKGEYELNPYLTRGTGSGLFYSNRIGLWYQQGGKCHVTKKPLIIPNCHHKQPKSLGGTDDYRNLVLIEQDIHIALHSGDTNIIKKLKFDKKSTKRYLNLLEIIQKSEQTILKN